MNGSPRVVKHAILQLKPAKGKRKDNLERFRTALIELRDAGEAVDVVVLPEGAFTGYFLQGGVRELAVTSQDFYSELEAIVTAVWPEPLDLVAGFFERHENEYFNSSLYAQFGEARPGDLFDPGIRHVHRKVFLPTYGVFDEERYQSRGDRFDAFDTRFGRSAMIICEDAWHTISSTICALKGAEVIYVPSASPIRGLEAAVPANVAYWHNLVRGIAAEHGVFVALSALPGFEGGKALMGASALIHPGGGIIAQAPILEDAIIVADINLDEIQPARYENPLLSDLRANLPRVMVSLEEAMSSEP
jgi:N-carbamoylputrescine amidase